MKFNIRHIDGLKEVNGHFIHYDYENEFKMFVYRDEKGFWYASEYYTGMALGDSQCFNKKQDCMDYAINGFYGGDFWKGRLNERIEYLKDKMLMPNLKEYGYANK